MKSLTRTLPKVLAPVFLLAASACQDTSGPTTLLDLPIASSVVIDFQAGDGDQFLFLPPLASGEPSAPLATGLDLTVTICDPTDACETTTAREEDDHYQVNWKSSKAQVGIEYAVTVNGSGISLGELTLTLEKKGNDKAGRTFPIKFWVGETLGEAVAEVADCLGDDRCNAAVVPADETVPTTIVTEDENGATMGEVTFPPASVPEGGLIVTLDCRQGGFDPGEGPLPTALDQWPLFCHVDVANPDGSAFTGSLASDASIEICVVDDLISGQSAFHGFVDHADLLLGKSSTDTDFAFLPPGPESLSCAGATTTASASPAQRVLDALGTRLARIFSPVMPEKLYARPVMFRDGGVGGLVSSFSDINPVSPAIIAGTVSFGGSGSGIAGVTVTLSGDAAASTTTNTAGAYSFSPLPAALTGSSYTVTVSGLPVGETLATSSQAVSVTGSGTFVADFETELPAGFFYNPDTGNYYRAEATRLSWPDARTAADALTFRACVGHLVTITSAGEEAFVLGNMPQVIVAAAGSGLGGGYWLGAYQPDGGNLSIEPSGGWEWVTGEPFGAYTNWAGAEPNNLGNNEHTMQYLGDWSSSEQDEQDMWNDEPGDRLYGYVVEYECP